MRNTVMAKLSPEDHVVVSTAVTTAVLASVTYVEEGKPRPWRPEYEYTSEIIFDVISSRIWPRKRRPRVCAAAIHHRHRDRAGGVRPGLGSLLAENRRRTERVPVRVLATLLEVEPHRVGAKV